MNELDKAKGLSWFVELPIGEPKWGAYGRVHGHLLAAELVGFEGR